jgi:hypothetical protein
MAKRPDCSQIGAKHHAEPSELKTTSFQDALISSREDRRRSSEFAPARDFGSDGYCVLATPKADAEKLLGGKT